MLRKNNHSKKNQENKHLNLGKKKLKKKENIIRDNSSFYRVPAKNTRAKDNNIQTRLLFQIIIIQTNLQELNLWILVNIGHRNTILTKLIENLQNYIYQIVNIVMRNKTKKKIINKKLKKKINNYITKYYNNRDHFLV